jgi:predicted site-specific integrase-resolvase
VSEKFYTYKELSERWGVAVNTLMQWVMAGILVPSMRLGRLVRFSESYILEIESKGGIKHAT